MSDIGDARHEAGGGKFGNAGSCAALVMPPGVTMTGACASGSSGEAADDTDTGGFGG